MRCGACAREKFSWLTLNRYPTTCNASLSGIIVSTVRNIKLGEDDQVDPSVLGRVIVFADELNKYAPKSDTSGRSLTTVLLEVTERGRSLGVILFGAEQ